MQKIKSNIRNLTCTQKALAEAIGLTPARINQLIEEEVVVPDESDKQGAVLLFDSLRNYFLSKNSSGGVNFWQEKGLNERAKRKMNEIKLRREEGAVMSVADVEAAFIEMLSILRNNLLGLPAKFAARLENSTREEIYNTLTAEIESKLEEMADFKITDN